MRKVAITIIDDFDGISEADETVSFSLDGSHYEIDLSSRNAAKLRCLFGLWCESARMTSPTPH
ncbi:histone-like nucleoid-structuring protein Lsr2 (plasmid) [Nocardia sp. CA-084685]|uniref:histone-like nucleoid-structuring protein Lsr2 n=1 Tax=Nocardia sp. CA-084685 TaxID=3239970 RepID=UPI003D97D429